ncbi:hypothetical protein PR202_gb08001 [Eleusine coracana subsp. coracana]|uniref:Uncharacterized protein n=1 Tax=Eleusine coracana subsp. coracana TaxID=191504 RepID=A0AAV5EEE4_ELECO|nr:hypothetical protein PR202_gb08001 [Eleusine coracana subsp. coracana]
MAEVIFSGAPPTATAAVRVLAVSRVAPAPSPAAGREGGATLPIRPAGRRPFSGGGQVPEGIPRAALALYLPLAGRLAYVAETEDIVVDYCSDSDNVGVAFVEAEAGGMDLRRLVGDEAHDVLTFHGLVPELDGRVLPAPVLSVQATRLRGGMALGVSVHHAAADGHALARFLDAWASASREGVSPSSGAGPCWSREAIFHPRGDEIARERLRKFAPNLPTIKCSASRRFNLQVFLSTPSVVTSEAIH